MLLRTIANFLVLELVLVSRHGSAEFYSSNSGLEQLLHTETVLLDELQNYVDEITQHAAALQSEIDAIKVEHVSATNSIEGYLNNPVNAFRLIKRLHSDWQTFDDSVETDASRTNYLASMDEHRRNLSFPTMDDFIGSALALTRLQQTYQLDVAELASGMLNGIKYGTAMSWQDCFVLGQHLYTLHHYNDTVPWLRHSMQLLVQQSYNTEPSSLDFMEAVIEYHQSMGDYENALELINYILAVQPEERLHLLVTKAQLERDMTDGNKQGLLHVTARAPDDYHSSQEYKLYEEVCRGDVQPTASTQRQLRCRYHSNGVAYRLLQPYKLEELLLDPYVVQLYDVIDAQQMSQLQRLARPLIQRSQVYAAEGSDKVYASFRTSQGAAFEYDTHASMQQLRRHVGDMSGLDMSGAELLQIANYGVGGHYEPHWDSFQEQHSYEADDVQGNRIATGIFYLSEVEAGGGTAFPFLHLLVRPQAGSMLFWLNLHSSGEIDYRTKHAACPVLQGSKWIANVWIRELPQHNTYPCKLQPDHDISLPYKEVS